MDRVDVTFDQFELGHANIPEHLATAVMTRMSYPGLTPDELGGVLMDAAAKAALGIY